MTGGSAQIRLRPGDRILVTTRLCETMAKSRTGHQFDSSQCEEQRHIYEYNNLQDPHLRDYFYRPSMKKWLIDNRYVTPELNVISPLRTYNLYRSYLEEEATKIRIGREKLRKHKSEYRKNGKFTAMDRERDRKKMLYLRRQEKILAAKERFMEHEEMKAKLQRRWELEQLHIRRVKNELKKQAWEAMARMKQLRKMEEQEEAAKTEITNEELEVQEQIREAEQRASIRLKHVNEFEAKWVENLKDLDDSSDEEREKEKREEEFKKHNEALEQRAKAIVAEAIHKSVLQERAPKPRAQLENTLWVHLLTQQADIRQREWGEVRRFGLEGWETVRRQWEQLQVQLRLRREVWRKEHAKLLSTLMRESFAEERQRSPVADESSSADALKSQRSVVKSEVNGSTEPSKTLDSLMVEKSSSVAEKSKPWSPTGQSTSPRAVPDERKYEIQSNNYNKGYAGRDSDQEIEKSEVNGNETTQNGNGPSSEATATKRHSRKHCQYL